jgi:hypothetical protein
MHATFIKLIAIQFVIFIFVHFFLVYVRNSIRIAIKNLSFISVITISMQHIQGDQKFSIAPDDYNTYVRCTETF